MAGPFAYAGHSSIDGGWTMRRLFREVVPASNFSSESLPLSIENLDSGIPADFHPRGFFNPLTDGDVGDFGSAKIFFCPELLMEPGCLLEDASRILDSHGYTNVWQQWKVKNAIVSMAMVSSIILAFSCIDSKMMELPFELGNCLPRSILFPFTGLEGRGCRHLIKDESILPREYNASSFNALSFIERSSQMTPEERWTNGNISGFYVKVHQKVSNVTRSISSFDSSEKQWKMEKQWIGRQNLYAATANLKRMVHLARAGRIHFIELDCRDLKKWFVEEYVDKKSGRLKRSRKINARKDFPEVWKEWTGLRPAGDASASVEHYESLSEAMNIHAREILDGSLVWTTHLEKIIRGLFLGSQLGHTLQELVEREERNEATVKVPLLTVNEVPQKPFIGSSEMQVNVEFDVGGVEKALSDSLASLDQKALGQLEWMLANGKKDGDRRWIRLHFRRRRHGRFYGHGNSVQMLPKWLRKQIFPAYASVDLNCAVFSIMKSQLMDWKYGGKTPEIDLMLQDKEAYRKSLANDGLDISPENVKDFLTMIGYGCALDVGRIVSAAEWNWLVETYGIEQTMYDIYHYAPGTALAEGATDPQRLMEIAEWASNPKVMNLWKEMQDGGAYLFSRMKHYAGGRPVLSNAWGEEMDIKSKRVTFGQKLAHIYQGAESMLLWKIMDGFDAGGRPLKDSLYGFGLPMHDGLGIHRDAVNGSPAPLVEKYVQENVGWTLKYDCE